MYNKKIITCVTMENPLEDSLFYNDAGADAIAFFDSSATRATLEENISVIKEITASIDIPLIACGGVRRCKEAPLCWCI